MPIAATWAALTSTIANGAATSAAFSIGASTYLGLVIPTGFEGSSITFTVSADDVTYQALYDSAGAQVTIPVAAATSYDLPGELSVWPYFKVVAPQNQGALRTLVLVTRE